MGRPRRSPEQRVEEMPELLRVELLTAKRQYDRAGQELEDRRQELAATILSARAQGVSLRDIAALLEVVHQTIAVLYKQGEKAA